MRLTKMVRRSLEHELAMAKRVVAALEYLLSSESNFGAALDEVTPETKAEPLVEVDRPRVEP